MSDEQSEMVARINNALAAPPETAPVAVGWQMVPVEPDWKMILAGGAHKPESGQHVGFYLGEAALRSLWDAMLAAAPSPPPRASDAVVTALVEAGWTAADAWADLVERTDRTSPPEYPDMALITFDELMEYMEGRDRP